MTEMTLRDSNQAVEILVEVLHEVKRQHALWGEQNHPDGTGPEVWWSSRNPTMAEFAKEAKLRCESRARRGALTYLDILAEEFFEAACEADKAALRAELVQVAAVAVSWVGKLDREPVQPV